MNKKNGKIVFIIFKAAAMALGTAGAETNIIGGIVQKSTGPTFGDLAGFPGNHSFR